MIAADNELYRQEQAAHSKPPDEKPRTTLHRN
jgi:hypothetical protein